MFIYSFSRRKKKTNFNNIMQFLKPFFKVLNFFFILNKKKRKKREIRLEQKYFGWNQMKWGKWWRSEKEKKGNDKEWKKKKNKAWNNIWNKRERERAHLFILKTFQMIFNIYLSKNIFIWYLCIWDILYTQKKKHNLIGPKNVISHICRFT